MKRSVLLVLAVAAGVLAPQAPAGPAAGGTLRRTWQFAAGAGGWTHGFADYPVGEEAFHELEFAHRALPPRLGPGRFGLYLSGNNHSDDLFLFVKAPVDGLEAMTFYDVRFQVRIASNAPKGAAGIGGAPGESVVLKAGAAPVEPAAVTVDGYQRMNVDIGSQSAGGADAHVLGHVGVATDVSHPVYRYKSLRTSRQEPFTAQTDPSGRLWLLLGTDSGFEGTTSLYVARVKVRLRRLRHGRVDTPRGG